jgi:hypothetical protein
MAASGATAIQLYHSSTAATAPTAGNLADGEPAFNLTDEKLYFKNAGGTVKTVASAAAQVGIITETVYAVSGTTPALDMANGPIQTWTLSGASTPTNSLTSGQSIILVITPGANTITWPSVVWTKQGGSGAAPTLFSAGKTDVILWMVGAVLYGSHLGDTA